MPTKFQIKRTSVSGRTPNTTNVSNTGYIAAGELALNLTDKKLFSSDGTNYFEAGSNLASLVVATSIDVGANLDINTSTIFIGNSTVNTVINSSAVSVKSIIANGSIGTTNKVLTSNGTGIYWGDSQSSTSFNIYSQTFTGNGSNTQFTLTTSTTTLETFVFINGVAQVPTTNYSVSGTTLTFVVAPALNDEIEVRTLDIPTILGIQFTLDNFTGNGSNTLYTLSTSLSTNTTSFVYLNGIAQVPTTDYGVSGSTLTFTTAPPNLQQIRVVTANPTGSYNSNSYTANSTVNNNFTLPIVTTTFRAMVFINGVAQAPSIDYYVDGTTLVLTTNAAVNDVVTVRSFYEEPSSSGPNNAVQYSGSGRLRGSSGFTFNPSTNNVTVANTITTPNFILNASNPPASPTATGTTGTFAWDSNYFYIATATNTWRKVNISANGVGGSNTNILYNDSNTFAGSAGFTFNNTTNNVTIANTLLIGANVTANTSTIFVGNSTVNTVITAGNIALNGSQLTIGNTTVNTSLTGDTFTLGNTFANTTVIRVGNSTVNTVINSTSIVSSGVSTLSLGNTTITGDLVVSGNVFFNGTTTNVNSTNLVVEDKNIILGDVGTPTDVTADGGGITLKGATDKTLNWVDATDAWTSSEDFNLVSGKSYEINGTVVVNSTSLGTGITGSSLTSVGTLTTLAAGNTTITGFANVSSTLQVTGVSTLSANLNVTGYQTITQDVYSRGMIRAAGWYTNTSASSATGLAVEIGTTGGAPFVHVYNRDASTYGPLTFHANSFTFTTQGTQNGTTIANSSATHAFFASNGNVGIGTTTPGAKLDVYASSGWSQLRLNGANGGEFLLSKAGTLYGQIYAADSATTGMVVNAVQSNYLFLQTNSTNALTIDNSQRIGIGTASPSSPLHVVTGSADSSGFNFETTGSSGKTFFAVHKLGFIRVRSSDTNGAAIHFYDNPGSKRAELSIGTDSKINWYSDALTSTWLVFDGGNGRVGIGTTSPNAKLDVFQSGALDTTTPGTTRYGIHLTPQNATVGTAVGITFGAGDSSSGTTAQAGIYSQFSGSYGTKLYFATTNDYGVGSKTRMMIDHNGNVGIGNTSPTTKLSVNGTSHFGDTMYFGSGGLLSWTSGYSDGTTQTINFNSVALSTNSSSYGLRQFWASNGNVGIGTSSPTGRLHVSGTSSDGFTAKFEASQPYCWIQVKATGGTTSSWQIGPYASGLNFYNDNNSAYRVFFGDNGNVGIGTTTPQSKLEVATSSGSFSHFGATSTTNGDFTGITLGYRENNSNYRKAAIVQEQIGDNSARGHLHLLVDIANDGGSVVLGDSKLMIHGTTGNIGIGTTSPGSYKLYVQGDQYISGTLTEASSVILKENINPISNALDLIANLTGVTYDRKDKSAINRAGFIAEEVEKVLPNVVQRDEEGNPSGIQYTNLIAYLVESIKELKAEIDTLKGK